LFLIAPKLQLSAGKNFNYEQATKVYNVTILVSDSKTSTGEYPIIVRIQDDDEPCYFDKSTYTVQMFEAGVCIRHEYISQFYVMEYSL